MVALEEPVKAVPLRITPRGRPRHFPHLDGLRACLALYVLMDHVYLTIWPAGLPAGAAMGFHRVFARTMTQGRAAVDWFIVLSGFCLMMPTLTRGYRLRDGAIDFYWKRARRILPTYWIATGLCVAMCLTVVAKKTGTHWDMTLPITWQAVVSALLLTNDIIDPIRINHVFWSIAVEWRIYFLFPAILWLWRRSGGKVATATIAVSATSVSYALPHISMKLIFLQTTLSFIGLFAMGVYASYLACGVHHRHGMPFKRWLTIFASVASVMAIASHAHLLPDRLSREPVFDFLYGLAMASWLARWSMPQDSFMRSALSWSPLPAIGAFAFSLYLIHAPMIQICWQVFVRPTHLSGYPAFVMLLFVATPIAVASAYVFFLYFERPFLSSRQRQAAFEEGALEAQRVHTPADRPIIAAF